jgi:hypothetical protein
MTVIVKEHVALLAEASSASQLMVETPTGNVVTLVARSHVTETVPLLSVAVAGFQLATPVSSLRAVKVVISAGHEMTGSVTSPTKTLNSQDALLSEVSVAVQDTTVLPKAKIVPELRVQTID